jgi:Curli production assembly/transport component CsgG
MYRSHKKFQRIRNGHLSNEQPYKIMKMKIPVILPLLLVAAAITRATAQDVSTNSSSPNVLSIAVFDFESKDEAVRDLGPKVATLLNAYLSAEPNLMTVERSELDKALGEQELGLSGTVTPDSAAKVGQLTGAKVLVTGRVFKTDTELFIVAKIIGTETSRVYGEIVEGNVDASISDLSEQLAKKIAADVTAKGDTLVAKVESREDRIAKIKKELGDKKLPLVSVKITEQHFGQYVIDPAAQTELSLILQQCGFTLADDNSTNRPDIEITGEAFSEFGMQKGNLKSCRARIEIKARDMASGNIISVDRQTSVAVDLAEHIAAKTALENGADELAERLLLKMVK